MMFNKKIFIAMILLLTFSCGYQPIYSTKQINKNYDFSINKIDFNEENLIAQSIRTNLKTYLNLKEKNNNFNIKISTTENKKIVSRNKQSDVEIFSLEKKFFNSFIDIAEVEEKINDSIIFFILIFSKI